METRGDTPKVWADTSDLAGLFEQPGPFLTVQLATEAAIDNASQRNQLRWRDQRERLAGEGVDEAILALIDPLVEDAHLSGQTLFAVATAKRLLHVSHWPDLPVREFARVGPLPSIGPLVELRQSRPAHVVVAADRVGADVWGATPEGSAVEGPTDAEAARTTKAPAGRWPRPRSQTRPENPYQH